MLMKSRMSMIEYMHRSEMTVLSFSKNQSEQSDLDRQQAQKDRMKVRKSKTSKRRVFAAMNCRTQRAWMGNICVPRDAQVVL